MLITIRRRGARTCFAFLVIALAVAVAFVLADPPAAAVAQTNRAIVYRPPVDAPVHDPFRAPTTPFGPGHRGIEYDTAPDTPVGAAAPGMVVFAGNVAGARWVTIRHPDGVRTTYGPLATVAVLSGQSLTSGDLVGTTAGRLLFTARVDDDYVDPALLLSAADEEQVHLVPEPTSLPSFPSSSFGVGDLLSPDAVLAGLSWARRRRDRTGRVGRRHDTGALVAPHDGGACRVAREPRALHARTMSRCQSRPGGG